MQDQRPTWRIWFVLIGAVALQTTWLGHWTLAGAHLDLPLLTVVSTALLLGWESGAAYGLVAGLLMGCFAAVNLGSYAVSRMAVGGVLGLFEHRFSRDNPFAPPLCAAGATLLANSCFFVMTPTSFPVSWWLHQTLFAAAMHAALILPLQWFMAQIVLPSVRYSHSVNRLR